MNKHILISLTIIILLSLGCKKKESSTGVEAPKGSIYGCVTDFATGEPVRNANVQLRPSGETTLTGYDGIYEFKDINDGDYSITVSKAEYTDLIDDYVISVRDGRRMKRDVQIQKQSTVLSIVDNNQAPLHELDFGSEVSLTSKMFNVFNNGTVKLTNCHVVYSCNWISSVSSLPSEILPGQTLPVIVTINRAFLAPGQNSTLLTVVSNNGNAEITIMATSSGGNPPTITILPASNVTVTSIKCKGQIQNANGGTITDCGFYYGTSSNPIINGNVVHIGPSTGTFTITLTNLDQNTTYHIKAFATSNLGTGYSSEITETTLSGLPVCGTTTITQLDPTTVRAESTAYGSNGYNLTEIGFCWSSEHSPTINDQVVTCTYHIEGNYHEYLNPLQPNTTYKVRSYAKSIFGISYGQEMMFTSLSGLATVTTNSAILSGDYVITGGDVIDGAGTVIVDEGVCYGSSPNPDLSPSFQHTYDGTAVGEGPFTSYIPKPTNSGYLYIRAYATTRYGTEYGNQVSIYIP